tara:strand:+ start:2309 stop:2449 length:141 start_codon:yes stop_codon:yes gene_type:complete
VYTITLIVEDDHTAIPVISSIDGMAVTAESEVILNQQKEKNSVRLE